MLRHLSELILSPVTVHDVERATGDEALILEAVARSRVEQVLVEFSATFTLARRELLLKLHA